MDEVLWIDSWTPPASDMDNARIQGGADYVESVTGYTGQGIRGYVYEGIEAGHQDFTLPATVVQSCSTPDRHGHCTAGIIFGNGTSHPDARGIAPDAQAFFTNDEDALGMPDNVLASGTMVVQPEEAFYSTRFSSPVDIRTGDRFFLAVLDDPLLGIRRPFAVGGAAVRHFTAQPGGPWNGPFQRAWAYRIHCEGPVPPELTVRGTPSLGRSFDISLGRAAPRAQAVLLFGASDTQ